jgi:hypothetical protein
MQKQQHAPNHITALHAVIQHALNDKRKFHYPNGGTWDFQLGQYDDGTHAFILSHPTLGRYIYTLDIQLDKIEPVT